MTINIDIKQHVKEFVIGSLTFELVLEDDKLTGFLKQIKDVASKVDTEKMIEEDPVAAFKHIEDQHRGFLELCFNEEAYDLVFAEVNKSSYVMSQVVSQISEEVERVIVEMTENRRTAKKADYYKKVKPTAKAAKA